MPLSLYQVSIPQLIQMLANLSAILDKAAAHATARKIDPAVFLGARLYPDMFPLVRQVQLASDFAKGAGARLAGIEVPSYPDTETTFDALKARLARTIEFLNGIKTSQVDGAESRDVTIPRGGQPKTYKGQTFLFAYALPNFYFHVTTAYDILRHCGVEVGKRDFLGPV